MPTIADIAVALASTSVRIRGREVVVRALTAAEAAILRKCLDRPTPPGVESNGAIVPNETDPVYLAALGEYRARLAGLEAAASIDLSCDGKVFRGDDLTASRAWAAPALKDVGDLTEAEIASVLRAGAELSGEKAVEAARGN